MMDPNDLKTISYGKTSNKSVLEQQNKLIIALQIGIRNPSCKQNPPNKLVITIKE